MLLETLSVLLPCADPQHAEPLLEAHGWVAKGMGALHRPASLKGDHSDGYYDIEAMLGCRVLTGLVCAHHASAQVSHRPWRKGVESLTSLAVCHGPRTLLVPRHPRVL